MAEKTAAPRGGGGAGVRGEGQHTCQRPLEGEGARCGVAATHLVRFIDEDVAWVCEAHALAFTELARAHSATISVTRAT